METKMIIGIDHGNRNMKTANTVFSAAIQPLQARPDRQPGAHFGIPEPVLLCGRESAGKGVCG